jgi:hypothetical protein
MCVSLASLREIERVAIPLADELELTRRATPERSNRPQALRQELRAAELGLHDARVLDAAGDDGDVARRERAGGCGLSLISEPSRADQPLSHGLTMAAICPWLSGLTSRLPASVGSAGALPETAEKLGSSHDVPAVHGCTT